MHCTKYELYELYEMFDLYQLNARTPILLQMTMDEFKRQIQDHFAVVLSWNEVRALQKLYGEPGRHCVSRSC